ncbi:hypothetical protein QCA50_017307 [Cerrena zonata]|uniref:Uncharacterized protein n=1 Tax=Cerrena zonata TaxID=2478898 RepID=A0AAW0FG84_9APHY
MHLSRLFPINQPQSPCRAMLAQFFIVSFLFVVCARGLPSVEQKRAPCPCPLDRFGDTGVPINTVHFFECVYVAGTCDWNMDNGELENTAQTNCPGSASCASTGNCACPNDNSGNAGRLIDFGQAVQCAYPNGACTFNIDNGALMNALGQGNCVAQTGC